MAVPQVPLAMASSMTCGALIARDRDALLALFRATGGGNWTRNDNWGTDAELSTWFGVEVNDQGRVVKLSTCTAIRDGVRFGNNLQGKCFLSCQDKTQIF